MKTFIPTGGGNEQVKQWVTITMEEYKETEKWKKMIYEKSVSVTAFSPYGLHREYWLYDPEEAQKKMMEDIKVMSKIIVDLRIEVHNLKNQSLWQKLKNLFV